MEALLIDGDSGRRITAIAQLERILAACHRHAKRLGCERELAALPALAARTGASRQLAQARDGDLRPVTGGLARVYSPGLPMEADHPFEPTRQAA
jgi:gamma-glutamyl:cysteine ligase YbdK (ATP-grasp superfamily)